MSVIISKRHLMFLRPFAACRGTGQRNLTKGAHKKLEGPINMRLLTKDALMRAEPRRIRRQQAPIYDEDEDDDSLHSAIDKMIAERDVTGEKIKGPQIRLISQRVVYPYPSFDEHRSHWAAFRRRLIYGAL